MKKKIIIGLIIFSLIFLLGGIYIISTIETATSKLDTLIKLHQVEILREHLLIQIKRVQADLNLKNTRYARSIDTVVVNVKNLGSIADTCFDCHHTKFVENRLRDLRTGVEKYKNALSRVFTIRANVSRLKAEEDKAFAMGEELINKVNNMISMASIKLESKTRLSLEEIAHTKIILYILISLVPFLAAGLGFIFISGFTKPVNVLLQATRKLKGGDLDYRIEGLKAEFGEVATSFNEMSASLKQYMHTILESEIRYRTLFESAGDAIFILEAEGANTGKILSANKAAAEMHGYEVNELLELNTIKDIDTLDAAEEAPVRFQDILDGNWIKDEITHQKKDGTVFPVEISAGLLQFMDHKYILAFYRDITERKQMEKLILQFNQDWEDTFNTITDMITIHDKDFNIIRANKAAEKILGLPFLEVSKVKCYKFYHGKDHPPENCPSCKCYETGEPVTFEMLEPHLNRFLEIRAMPRFDKNNQIIGLIHVVRDITERKQVEEALQRAEQMKMVGEWAAGLAHEIKNSLAGIKVSVEILGEETNISEEDKDAIVKAVDEIKRIDTLLRSLLNFAKPPKPQFTPVDINDILEKTIDFSLKHRSLPSNNLTAINILKDFDKNLPETLADPLQLQQIFLNLLFNASEAIRDGGTLSVKTAYDEKVHAIQVEVSDSGKGIDEKVKHKIFQPFFTTKSRGSGLGLAITKRFVEQHGGDICAENKPGGGAAFYVIFPVKEMTKEKII